MKTLPFLMDVLDSYATFRINRSILVDVIRSKCVLGLDPEAEIAEFFRDYFEWDYVLRCEDYCYSRSSAHIQAVDDCTFKTFWRYSQSHHSDHSIFSSLPKVAMTVLRDFRDFCGTDNAEHAFLVEWQREQWREEMDGELAGLSQSLDVLEDDGILF